MAFEASGKKEQVSVSEQRQNPPFPADRLQWTEADYARELEKMGDIPCIEGSEAAQAIGRAMHNLDWYIQHEKQISELWQTEVKAFSPKQVIMRYGGRPWNYHFRRQRMEGASSAADETEPVVTGIAKKIVETVSRTVHEYAEKMKAADSDVVQAQLGRELTQAVEGTFEPIFPQKNNVDHLRVTELMGPCGPVYFTTVNGNHRLAAARLIGLEKVRGEVRQIVDAETAQAYWFNLLAILDQETRDRVLRVYRSVYPTDTVEERTEGEALKDALSKREEMMHHIDEIQKGLKERNVEAIKQEEAQRHSIKSEYALAHQVYKEHQNDPEFKRVLYEVAFDHLVHHPSDAYVARKGLLRMDEQGWLYDAQNESAGHVLDIDLNEGPDRTTKSEIIVKAVKVYKNTKKDS
jgi:hypothetical protein